MKSIVSVAMAIFAVMTAAGAAQPATGLLIYREPSSGFTEAFEVVNVVQNRVYSEIVLPDGREESYKTGGILELLKYPPPSIPPYFEGEAKANLQKIASLTSQFPQFRTQLEAAGRKWQNALELTRKQPKAGNNSIELGGARYSDAKLESVVGETATVRHADGISKIQISSLTEPQIAILNRTSGIARIEPLEDHIQKLRKIAEDELHSYNETAAAAGSDWEKDVARWSSVIAHLKETKAGIKMDPGEPGRSREEKKLRCEFLERKLASAEHALQAAQLLGDRICREKREKLLSEGLDQERAANYDRALELFTQAGSRSDIVRLASSVARDFEKKGDFESAAAYFESAGLYEEAGRIRKTHDLSKSASKRHLDATEIYRSCGPACVTVLCKRGDGHTGQGSGFFISKDGYILTNNHVVLNAKSVTIETSSGRTYAVEVIQTSKTPDLALLKAEINQAPFLKLGNSDKMETGGAVFAIGTPKGLAQSITSGIISFSDREYNGNKVFQINVLINHGNSGGPLINCMGEVVGVNSFGEGTVGVLSNGTHVGSDIQGINYAIKINEARDMIFRHAHH